MNRIIIMASVLFLIGCKNDPPAKPIPVIVIDSPASNQHYVMGDTIHITGTVTHSIALTEVAVHMTDITSNIEFFHNHFGSLTTYTYHFDVNYLIPDNKKSSFNLEVEASDKEGNTALKEMLILIN